MTTRGAAPALHLADYLGPAAAGSEPLRWAAGLAAGLGALGVGSGDRVAIVAREGLRPFIAETAVQLRGGVAALLPPDLDPPSLLRALTLSGARQAIVGDMNALRTFLAVRPDVPMLEVALLLEPPEGEQVLPALRVDDVRAHGESLLAVDALAAGPDASSIGPASPARWWMSSFGEGASPRLLSHSSLMRGAELVASLLEIGASDAVVLTAGTPSGMGRAVARACWTRGASLHVVPQPEALVEMMASARPTLLVGTRGAIEVWTRATAAGTRRHGLLRRGLDRWSRRRTLARQRAAVAQGRTAASPKAWARALEGLAWSGVRDRATGGRLRRVMAVGPPLDDDVAEFLCSWGVAVAEGLAADEVAGPMTFSAEGIVRLGTSGRPVEGLEIEAGPDGYLRVRGPAVASEVSPRGGPGDWLRIGLRGATDEQGRVRLS